MLANVPAVAAMAAAVVIPDRLAHQMVAYAGRLQLVVGLLGFPGRPDWRSGQAARWRKGSTWIDGPEPSR